MLCEIMSNASQNHWKKKQADYTRQGVLSLNNDSHKDFNIQFLKEFTWEGKRKDETVHFLSPPPEALEWTDFWPSDLKLKKMKRTPKERPFELKSVAYKVHPTFNFLAGIQLKFTNGF